MLGWSGNTSYVLRKACPRHEIKSRLLQEGASTPAFGNRARQITSNHVQTRVQDTWEQLLGLFTEIVIDFDSLEQNKGLRKIANNDAGYAKHGLCRDAGRWCFLSSSSYYTIL